jgi:hypothetical protein
VQEGGVVKFKATEDPPVRLPVLVTGSMRRREPRTRDVVRTVGEDDTAVGGPLYEGRRGVTPLTAKPRLLELAMTPACLANPLGGKTTDWRAVCGRSACTVRREGRLKPMSLPYPYVRLQVCLVREV